MGHLWSNTTEVNYAFFGCDCINDFLAGFSTIAQGKDITAKRWSDGSDNTTQVYYPYLGGNCYDDLLAGFLAFSKDNPISHKFWHCGSLME